MDDTEQPPDPQSVPWGSSLIGEYYELAAQADRLGFFGDKDAIFAQASCIRAKAVNEFLVLLRWCREDAPGILEQLLAPVIDMAVSSDFQAVAADITALRLRRAG